jgi:RNA polymerase sigma factor (sigma-70 family)
MPFANRRGYATGDREAFTRIYQRFYDPLCLYAHSFIADYPAAEDLVSDVFEKLWVQGGEFETVNHVKNWLYTCTRNAGLSHLKRAVAKPVAASLIEENDHLTVMIRQERLGYALSLLEILPAKCRKIFLLYHLKGWSAYRIAAHEAISVYTVKAQLARGKALLKSALQKRKGGK